MLVFTSPADAEIIFHDDVSIAGETVMLTAETKGRFFRKGGELVEFVVDKKSLGTSLSGGDGFAFREFIPHRFGLYKVSAVSGKEKDRGFLMSLHKGDKLVFVDVEEGIFVPLSNRPRKGSVKVIKALSKRFPIVYLQKGLLDVKTIRKWLVEKSFPEAPVLPWEGGAVFSTLSKKGIGIKVIISSAAIIESAREFKPEAFCFEETEGALEVKDWEEIGKKMRLVIK